MLLMFPKHLVHLEPCNHPERWVGLFCRFLGHRGLSKAPRCSVLAQSQAGDAIPHCLLPRLTLFSLDPPASLCVWVLLCYTVSQYLIWGQKLKKNFLGTY